MGFSLVCNPLALRIQPKQFEKLFRFGLVTNSVQVRFSFRFGSGSGWSFRFNYGLNCNFGLGFNTTEIQKYNNTQISFKHTKKWMQIFNPTLPSECPKHEVFKPILFLHHLLVSKVSRDNSNPHISTIIKFSNTILYIHLLSWKGKFSCPDFNFIK